MIITYPVEVLIWRSNRNSSASEERENMQIINKGYLFPAFWFGLIISTYLGIGEYYLLFSMLCAGVLWLTRFTGSIKVHKRGCFKYFVAYYVLVSTFGLMTGYVGFKNFTELIMKYIFLPAIIFFLIPEKYSERIAMVKALKIIFFASVLYGLVESILNYNFMVNFVQIGSKVWMSAMNNAANYQPCSFFLHYNYYGCVLILGLILGRYIPFKNKFMNAVYLIVVLEQILVCRSRICWIATIVIFIIEIIQSKRITNKNILKLLVVLLAALCIVIFIPSILSSFGKFISDRFSRIWIYGFDDGSLGQRLGTLSNWPAYFSNNILEGIFGTGYQSVSVNFMKEYSYFEGYSTADCQLTVYLVETGIVGVAILVFAIFQFLRQKAGTELEEAKIIRIGKLAFIAYIIECFTLDLVSNNIALSLILLVLLVAIKRQRSRQNEL